ncbi:MULTISPECIES: DsbA family protein [unclassified Paenibacillus]|uniref:DsbA family oxidoreductase n=1 Tax=unclassified Paenibacillus TaxID=185978 RepID=UPI001AE7276D|nr:MULTISPECIES: DsbA family protein [unclassified Paenibacillus]MBP1153779.1 putative DsbA family dithiol-disulfide isomerase [Paenibacillus sp. PvP091]MBP1170836.1 putative DsbA family dithiol-disulfide isomerase [Paenibacillus sp. PvR098]MBP2441864.1 putative DsbA family dithiol-disulfide isomerase [Paenibacillus sp. PvP052]
MTLKIKVYSDYVCPFCYIAEVPLEEAVKGKDVEVEWMPYELRPYPNETLRPEDEYLPRVWNQSVYPMAAQYGLNMVLPNVSPQPHTHLAFEGFQYAKEHGKGNEYTHRMFGAFFQEEQDIGQIDVLTRIAGELGLNESEFRHALETRKYQDIHRKALEHAVEEAKITAVPTFKIGETVVQGVRSKESIERIIEEELAKKPKLLDFGEGMACGVDGC